MPRVVRIIILVVACVGVWTTLWPRLADSRIPGNFQGYAPEQPIAYSHRLHAGELGIACQYCHFGAARSRHAGIPPANVCMNCHRSVKATMGERLALDEASAAAKEAGREKAGAKEADGKEAKSKGAGGKTAGGNAADGKKTDTAAKSAQLISEKLQVLYDYLDFDPKTGTWDAEKGARPIHWKQVHRLPDFVYFDHRAHVRADVDCQRCHGPIESMERVRQFSNLSMGWCVNCHRDARANGIKGQPASPSLDCSACHY